MNSELIYITRELGYPASFGTRSALGDFLEQYPDGVYAENGGGAPIGWESAAVWFGGDSERAAARFEMMMSERNELARLFRTRVSGVLVITFIYRLKSRMVTAIPIIGVQPQPIIDPTWLYFTIPEGGTVSLTKNGTPTAVTLEYSLDNGNTWTEWVETENVRSLTLTAGQTMHVRNTSETSTRFSVWDTNYYNFSFSDDTYAGGDLRSMVCKTPSNASNAGSNFCFFGLFMNATNLIEAKIKLLFTDLPRSFYRSMFEGCSNLIEVPDTITATTASGIQTCYRMFLRCSNITKLPKLTLLQIPEYGYGNIATYCSNLNYVHTEMTDISGNNCLSNWLQNVSPTGDFYCPAELTIPTGASGIPSGWTRHDI